MLKTEFEGTIGKLGPLRERIEKTDRLIDGCAAVRAHGRGDRDSGRSGGRIVMDLVVTEPSYLPICRLIAQNK